MKLHLENLKPTHSPPPWAVTGLTHPNLLTFLPLLISPFSPSFPSSWPSSHSHTPTSIFLTFIISFQCSYLWFHLTPLPHLSHQPTQFSQFLVNCSSFPSHMPPSHIPPPSSLLTSCWHIPQRGRKGGQTRHNIGSRFNFQAVRMQDWWFGGFQLVQRGVVQSWHVSPRKRYKERGKAGKRAKQSKTILHVWDFATYMEIGTQK